MNKGTNKALSLLVSYDVSSVCAEGSQDLKEVSLRRNQVAKASNLDPQELLAAVLQLEVDQVVSADGPNADLELKISEAMSLKSESFFESPLQCILFPSGSTAESEDAAIFRYKFSSSEQKVELFEKLEKFLLGRVPSSSLRYDIKIAADEMFTNSIYNAPAVKYDSKTSGVQRDGKARMPAGYEGELEVGIYQERLAVVCRDPFGSLNPRYILNKVYNCYSGGVGANINQSPLQGAGIGCFLIYKACLAYYLAVKRNQCSIVGTTFSLAKGHRSRADLPKNIHVLDCS